MANFMDLPKAVREKIYRLHLIADEQPITFEAHIKTCGYPGWVLGGPWSSSPRLNEQEKRKMPPLLHVNRKIEKEASLIYFGENTFALSGPEDIVIWKRFAWPRHLRHISKVVLLRWTRLKLKGADDAFANLWKFLKIECLTVVIDEEQKVRGIVEHHPVIRCGGRSGIGPQIGLQLLHLNGIDGFRGLRNVQKLKFVKSASAFDSDGPEDIGSVLGGVLESIRGEIVAESLAVGRPKVAKEIKGYVRGLRWHDDHADIEPTGLTTLRSASWTCRRKFAISSTPCFWYSRALRIRSPATRSASHQDRNTLT